MAHQVRELIRELLDEGKPTQRYSKPSGVVRLWRYDRAEEKIALYVDTAPPANTPYEAYTDFELEAFIESLYVRFKKSPLWNWYSRSSTWAKYGQAFVETTAYRIDSEAIHTEKEVFGKVKPRKGNTASVFFDESTHEIAQPMLKRYQVHIVDGLGVRLLHGKR
jgi:hypothetical protein